MHLPIYLGLQHDSERALAKSWRTVADAHLSEADLHHLGHMLAEQCDQHVSRLGELVETYGERHSAEPERLRMDGLGSTRSGPVGLLRDLQDLHLLASFTDLTWSMLWQAGQAVRDRHVLDVVASCQSETSTQLSWLRTRLAQAAPQALVGA